MKTSLVIFDLDGTLLNTIMDLGDAVNRICLDRGLPTHSYEEYTRMVGHGMRNLSRSAMPQDKRSDEAFVDSFLKDFLDYYHSHIYVHTAIYPGIGELVKRLQTEGFKLAIASNKFQLGTETLVRHFFPDIEFSAICGGGGGFPLKPEAALVEYIIGKAGVQREQTVMVGDSGTDILTAANSGIRSIAVSWGFRDRESLTGADIIADNAEELYRAITSI
ncbi:MAG: HAD family hydrolase [Bacteroidales bacterium]|nr:HAD family hydrolase [Bacteroidales bacterium]